MDLTPQEQEEFEFRYRYEQEQAQGRPSGKSLEGFVDNAWTDAGQLATGMGQTIKEGAFDMPMRTLGTGLEMAAGKPYSGTPSGQRDVELVQQAPEQLKEMVRPVTHPLEYGYEHPVQQGLNIASAALPLFRGAAKTGAKYAGRFGEDAMGKLHGTKPGIFNKITGEKFGPAMRSSYEMGDAKLLQGPMGREQMLKERINQLGQGIGEHRAEATAAGPAMTPNEMADLIQKETGPKYTPGGELYKQQGSFEKELGNIRAMPEGGIENFAQRATSIKKSGQTNILNQLPADAETDIANSMSHINDAEIAKRLPPELTEDYQLQNSEFGKAMSLKGIQKKSEGFERMGTGSNTTYGDVKKMAAKTILNPKVKAHGWFGAEKALQGAAEGSWRAPTTIGGVTAHLMTTLQSNPQSLGQYAAPLLKAAQTGGKQGLAATHYILSTTHPAYNELMSGKEQDQNDTNPDGYAEQP